MSYVKIRAIIPKVIRFQSNRLAFWTQIRKKLFQGQRTLNVPTGFCVINNALVIVNIYIFFLLLLQLAHHPTKDSGRGLTLLRKPSIPPRKDAKDIAHFRELVGRGNFTIKMDFKQHPMGQPLLAQLIQSGRTKGCTALWSSLNAYIQLDLNSTLLHFQPVKVSLGVPLQRLNLNIVLFLNLTWSVSEFKADSSSTNKGQGHQPAVQVVF